jgi:hypothetical protein
VRAVTAVVALKITKSILRFEIGENGFSLVADKEKSAMTETSSNHRRWLSGML